MNIDDAILNAYRQWKNYVGILSFIGFSAYIVSVFLLSLFSAILVALGAPENIETAPAWVWLGVSLALVLSGIVYNVVGVVGNAVVRERAPTIGKIFQKLKERFLDVAITTLLVSLPAITGLLVGLAFTAAGIVYFPEYQGILTSIGVIAYVLGALISVYFSLAPYYATDKSWKEATETARERGKKIYITLFLTHLFFLIVYITAATLFPDPNASLIFFVIADAAFLMHLRHQTFFELTH